MRRPGGRFSEGSCSTLMEGGTSTRNSAEMVVVLGGAPPFSLLQLSLSYSILFENW